MDETLTDAQIVEIATKAFAEDRLSWLGFEKDSGGRYTIPVLEQSDFQLVRAVLAALDRPQTQQGEALTPFGYVTKDTRGVQWFYKDAPYLDNAAECVTVFSAQQAGTGEPMTEEQKRKLIGGFFADKWAVDAALDLLHDYDRRAATPESAPASVQAEPWMEQEARYEREMNEVAAAQTAPEAGKPVAPVAVSEGIAAILYQCDRGNVTLPWLIDALRGLAASPPSVAPVAQPVAWMYTHRTKEMKRPVVTIDRWQEDLPIRHNYEEHALGFLAHPSPAANGTAEPMQPVVMFEGVARFKENRIVWDILQVSAQHGLGLNQLAMRDGYTPEERMQVAQLIGYSVDGYGSLSYVTAESYNRADELRAALSTEKKESP